MIWDEKKIKQYVEMTKDWVNPKLIFDTIDSNLSEGSTILELGSGPCTDYKILSKRYEVTPTDYCQPWIDYHKTIGVNSIIVDAKTIEVDKKFDCIYSNKILQHLKIDEFEKSIKKQLKTLNKNGILIHAIWNFTKEQEPEHAISIPEIQEMFKGKAELLEFHFYKEMKENDSVLFVLRRLEND